MENFSQDENEKDLKEEVEAETQSGQVTVPDAKPELTDETEKKEGADIVFEEPIDIDEIQKKLEAHQVEINPELPKSERNNENQNYSATGFGYIQNARSEKRFVDPTTSKKYVIYIDNENVDFIDSLSFNDRKKVINDILKEKNTFIKKTEHNQQTRKFLTHALIATFTVLIFLPVSFLIVNKSIELTINNYKQSKKNFIKLYKEQGKIKPTAGSAMDRFKY